MSRHARVATVLTIVDVMYSCIVPRVVRPLEGSSRLRRCLSPTVPYAKAVRNGVRSEVQVTGERKAGDADACVL